MFNWIKNKLMRNKAEVKGVDEKDWIEFQQSVVDDLREVLKEEEAILEEVQKYYGGFDNGKICDSNKD